MLFRHGGWRITREKASHLSDVIIAFATARNLIPLCRQMPDMRDIRQDGLISAASASDKPHLSNYKAFLDDDVTAERRYAAIEMFNIR